MNLTIPSPKDVADRLTTEDTGLRRRCIDLIGTTKSLDAIHVKVSQASEAEIASVTQQLQRSGWTVGRGKSGGLPVLILSASVEGDARTTTGVIHGVSTEGHIPGRTMPEGPAGLGVGDLHIERVGDGVAPVRDAIDARPASKSPDEAARGLSVTVVELRDHMRLRGIEAPPAWSSPTPEAQGETRAPDPSPTSIRSAVTMAASPAVAARKLGVDEVKLRELMVQHQIVAPRSWPTPSVEPPRGTDG